MLGMTDSKGPKFCSGGGRVHNERGVSSCEARLGRLVDHGSDRWSDGERQLGSGRVASRDGLWGGWLMSSFIQKG